MDSWINEVIAKLESTTEGILQFQIGDKTLQAFISQETVNFFKNNKLMLINIGKDKFKDFLWLINQNKQEEAFKVLLKGMDADAIIARMNMNAEALKEANDRQDAFIAALKKFVIQTLTSAATKALLALI